MTGEGKFQVAALYLGTEALADVTAVRAPGVTGDVNGDGRLSISDIILALRAVVGLVTFGPEVVAVADVNSNGRLDIGDVVSLLRRVVGLPA
ncbi:MAG: dockerin type I repeat-containing protein [Armatimonadota bacterium]